MKRRAPIAALLRWAYVEQLPRVAADRGPLAGPRQPGNHMSGAAAAAMVSGGDGRVNVYGLLPSLAERDLPVHRDAIAIGEVVRTLDGLEIEAGEVDLIGDEAFTVVGFDDYDAETHRAMAINVMVRENEAGLMRASRDLAGLVRRAAILGLDDGRRTEPLVIRPLRAPNGRTAWFRRETYVSPVDGLTYECEVDGYDARRKRPHPEAFRRWTCDGDPAGLATRRAEWQTHQAALGVLELMLAGMLDEYEVAPFVPDYWPWRRAAGGARVLEAAGGAAQPEPLGMSVRAGAPAPEPRWPGRSVAEGGAWRIGEKIDKGA